MNVKSITLLLLIVVCCAGVNSCSNPADDTPHPPAIHGRVVDSMGRPVKNAGVGLIFNYAPATPDSLKPGISIGPNPASDMRELHVIVAVRKSGRITIQLLRADTREQVKTIVDSYRESGAYLFLSQLTDIPNQAYIVQYINEGDTVERLMILNHHVFSNIKPFVTTDSDGRFMIDYSSLPIGRSFQIGYDDGGTTGEWGAIGDSLRLTISAPDNPKVVHMWNLKVDADAAVDSTFVLK